jgi:hypothetical protein
VGLADAVRLGGGEKLVGGGGAILVMDGISLDLCRPVLSQIELGAESEWRQWVHSASCTAAMP